MHQVSFRIRNPTGIEALSQRAEASNVHQQWVGPALMRMAVLTMVAMGLILARYTRPAIAASSCGSEPVML